MAEASNTIEVLIKAIDSASTQLVDIEKRLAAIETQTKHTDDATAKLTGTWAQASAAVVVLNQGLEYLNKVFEPTIAHFDRGIAAAGQFQQETTILASTLQVLGKNIPVQNLVDFSEEMARANGVSSESVLAAERQLASLTKLNEQGIKKVIEGSLALSKVTDVDFGTAIRRSIALLQGNTTQIMRGIDAINQHIPLVEREAALQQYLSTFIEANTKSTETYQRTQRVLNNAIEDFHKALGSGIIDRLQELNPELTKYVDKATEIVKANPQIVAGIYGVAKALDEMKGVLIALAALQLTGALGFLAGLIANPVALATVAAIVLGGAAAFAVFNNQMQRTADIDAAKNIEDTTARIAELTKQLSDYKAEQVRGLGEAEAARRAKNDPTVLALEARIQALQAAKRQLESTTIPDIGPTSHEPILPEVLSKEEQETRRIIEKMQGDIAKGRADIKAAQEQFIFETTGDFNAQLRAFAATQAGIAAAAAAQVNEQVKSLKEQMALTPEQEGRIRGALTAQATLQIQQSQIQQRKALFDQEQAAIKLNLGLQQAIAQQINAQAAVEERRLGVLRDQNATIAQQAAQEQILNAFKVDEHLKTIETLTAEKERLEALQRAGNLEKQRQIDLQNIINQLIKEKDTLDEINDTIVKSDRARLDQSIARNIASRRGDIQATVEADQSQLEILQHQLSVLQDEGKPYSDILSVLARIDVLQRSILEKQIAQKQVDLDQLRAKTGTEAATAGQLAQAEAELEHLKASYATIADGVRKATVDLHRQAQSMADDVAGTFVDGFIQYMSNSEGRITDIFASLGKTIMSEFLRTALATLLTKPFEDMLRDWGANAAEGFKRGGLGGSLFGGILDMLGVGKKEGPILKAGAVPGEEFFSGTKDAVDAGVQNLDKSMTQGLSDLLDTAISGFGDFFGNISRSISRALQALASLAGGEGGGLGLFQSILGIFGAVVGVVGGIAGAGGGATPSGTAGSPAGGNFAGGPGNFQPLAPMPTFSSVSNFAVPQSFMRPFQQTAVAAPAMKAAAPAPVTVQQAAPQIIINGSITPEKPGMTPEQVIRVVYNDMDRGGMTSKATVQVIKRNR